MTDKLLDVTVQTRYPYRYSCGTIASEFFRALRDDRRILGRKCPTCGRVYIPPRPVCGPCWSATTEWVEIGPRGVLECFTVVTFTFLDPMTGKTRPVPYGYGMIRLDGSQARFQHFLEENDPRKLKVGLRVEAVFNEERRGTLSDIKHFRIVE